MEILKIQQQRPSVPRWPYQIFTGQKHWLIPNPLVFSAKIIPPKLISIDLLSVQSTVQHPLVKKHHFDIPRPIWRRRYLPKAGTGPEGPEASGHLWHYVDHPNATNIVRVLWSWWMAIFLRIMLLFNVFWACCWCLFPSVTLLFCFSLLLCFDVPLLLCFYFIPKNWVGSTALVDQPIVMTCYEHHAECTVFFKDVILE